MFLRNEVQEIKQPKKGLNGDFQIVGSLIYAHYPIFFILLFGRVCCVKIKEKNESTNMDLTYL